jgi:hypothetical protein
MICIATTDLHKHVTIVFSLDILTGIYIYEQRRLSGLNAHFFTKLSHLQLSNVHFINAGARDNPQGYFVTFVEID